MGGRTDPGTAFGGIKEQNSVPDNHRGAATTVVASVTWQERNVAVAYSFL